jgi:hypothetical protein
MKSPFSARLGAYLVVFGLLCDLVIARVDRLQYAYREPLVPLPVAMLLAYGLVLFIRPSIAQLWEHDDLFDRATRRGFIARASGPWEATPGDISGRISSRLRRHVPPDPYCLKLSTVGLLYALPLAILVAAFMLGEGYGRSWRASHIFGLRVYVAGPSGMAQPWVERSYEKLVVKVTSEPDWFMGNKQIPDAEGRRIRRMPERFWRGRLSAIYHWRWYLNSKTMTQVEIQHALKQALSQRRVRFVYLDVDHAAPFLVAVEAIEAVKQAPDTRVVLVTEDDQLERCVINQRVL